MASNALRRVQTLGRHAVSSMAPSMNNQWNGSSLLSVRCCAGGPAARNVQQLEVNGRSLHVVTTGNLSSSMPVICLPGAMGTAETDFAYQLDGLSKSHGVISFDPRGYGKSRPPNRRYPVDFYHLDAEDAAGIVDALGCKSCHVIGW